MELNDYWYFLEEMEITQEQMDAALAKAGDPLVEDAPYYLAPSTIHGTGVFASEDLSSVFCKFRVDEKWYEPGRYMNHSPTPNCMVVEVDGGLSLYSWAKKDEELTVNYRQVKSAHAPFSTRYLVVDDFCDDPEAVVGSAHDAGFSTWLPKKGLIGSSVYDGMGFWGKHALMIAPIIAALGTVIVPNSMFFRVTNTDTETAYIHSDRETGNYTAVVYLSEHDTPYGTAFFRHKRTGLIHMPSVAEMQTMGILEELTADMVSRDPDKWEQLVEVEGQYNRALIFEAPLFHSRFPVTGIGETAEDGRLVWASHFYKLAGDGSLF